MGILDGNSDFCRTGQKGGVFAATHWSLVLRAGDPKNTGAAAALETLCRAYWYPVYAWIRSRGHGPEEAQDLTQEFFAGLLRKDSLQMVGPEKGKFRTWIIRCIQNLLTDHHRVCSAEKRGGGGAIIEWDGLDPEARYALEPATKEAPDVAFDRRWSRVLLARAFQRLEAEQAALGRAAEFLLLRDFIGAPPGAGDYERIGQKLGATQNNLAVTVRRLRARCRELVMEEIMQTVHKRSEAEEELRALFGK
jgi:RNA polymerase sigma factor (sigma-70 family)